MLDLPLSSASSASLSEFKGSFYMYDSQLIIISGRTSSVSGALRNSQPKTSALMISYYVKSYHGDR